MLDPTLWKVYVIARLHTLLINVYIIIVYTVYTHMYIPSLAVPGTTEISTVMVVSSSSMIPSKHTSTVAVSITVTVVSLQLMPATVHEEKRLNRTYVR